MHGAGKGPEMRQLYKSCLIVRINLKIKGASINRNTLKFHSLHVCFADIYAIYIYPEGGFWRQNASVHISHSCFRILCSWDILPSFLTPIS